MLNRSLPLQRQGYGQSHGLGYVGVGYRLLVTARQDLEAMSVLCEVEILRVALGTVYLQRRDCLVMSDSIVILHVINPTLLRGSDASYCKHSFAAL